MPPPLETDEQEIAGFRLKFQPPDGYCVLEAGQVEDALATAARQKRLGPATQVIFSFADCAERARFRQGERAALMTTGSVIIGQIDEKPRVIPTISRQDYLANFAKWEGKAADDPSHTKILTDHNLAPSDRNARYISVGAMRSGEIGNWPLSTPSLRSIRFPW